MSEDGIKWKWEAPTVLSYRGTYADGFKAGLEAAARYMENQAKLHAERLEDVGEEPYLSDRARWTAGHLFGVAKALRERAEWERRRGKTIEREGK